MAGASRSRWAGALRALLILGALALLLDSLALTRGPWLLIPPLLPLGGLAWLIGHAAGGR